MLVDSDDRNLEGFLAECVHESLANYQLPNAVFLSERLYAAVPSEVRASGAPPSFVDAARAKMPHEDVHPKSIRHPAARTMSCGLFGAAA